MGYSLMPYFEDEVKSREQTNIAYCRECDHKDCIYWRKMRESKCVECGKGFYAGDKYYGDSEKNIRHAHCEWNSWE